MRSSTSCASVLSAPESGFSKCVDTFDKALARVETVLTAQTTAGTDEVHSAKSALYAAIERTGHKAEKIFYAQRMLRELMAVLNGSACISKCEKEAALQIIQELKKRYRRDIFLS